MVVLDSQHGFFNGLLEIADGLLEFFLEFPGVLGDLVVNSLLVVDASGVVLLQVGDVVLVESVKKF